MRYFEHLREQWEWESGNLRAIVSQSKWACECKCQGSVGDTAIARVGAFNVDLMRIYCRYIVDLLIICIYCAFVHLLMIIVDLLWNYLCIYCGFIVLAASV